MKKMVEEGVGQRQEDKEAEGIKWEENGEENKNNS